MKLGEEVILEMVKVISLSLHLISPPVITDSGLTISAASSVFSPFPA